MVDKEISDAEVLEAAEEKPKKTPIELAEARQALDKQVHEILETTLSKGGEDGETDLIASIIRYPKVKKIVEILTREKIMEVSQAVIQEDRKQIYEAWIASMGSSDVLAERGVKLGDSSRRGINQVLGEILNMLPMHAPNLGSGQEELKSEDLKVGDEVLVTPVHVEENKLAPSLLDVKILTDIGEEVSFQAERQKIQMGQVPTIGEVTEINGLRVSVKFPDKEEPVTTIIDYIQKLEPQNLDDLGEGVSESLEDLESCGDGGCCGGVCSEEKVSEGGIILEG